MEFNLSKQIWNKDLIVKEFNLSELIDERELIPLELLEDILKEFINKTLDIVLDINKTDIRKAGEIKALAGDKFK